MGLAQGYEDGQPKGSDPIFIGLPPNKVVKLTVLRYNIKKPQLMGGVNRWRLQEKGRLVL